MNVIIKIFVVSISLSLFSCVSKNSRSEKRQLEYLNCKGEIIGKGNLTKDGKKTGVWDYSDNLTKKWLVDSTSSIFYSKIEDWEVTNDGGNIFLNSNGEINKQKAQVIFWASGEFNKTATIEELSNKIDNNYVLRDSIVYVERESYSETTRFKQYSLVMKGGAKFNLFDIVAVKDGIMFNLSYYYKSDDYNLHVVNFMEHLTSVYYGKKLILTIEDCFEIMDLPICSYKDYVVVSK